jgi:hypothetical protein
MRARADPDRFEQVTPPDGSEKLAIRRGVELAPKPACQSRTNRKKAIKLMIVTHQLYSRVVAWK